MPQVDLTTMTRATNPACPGHHGARARQRHRRRHQRGSRHGGAHGRHGGSAHGGAHVHGAGHEAHTLERSELGDIIGYYGYMVIVITIG